MSHWKDRLLEADRALTSELSAEETQRLRRTVVAEAASAVRSRHRWSLPFLLTAGSLTAASAALVLSAVTALPGATAPPAGDLAVAGEIAPETPPDEAAAVSSFNSQHPAARGSSGSSMPNSR